MEFGFELDFMSFLYSKYSAGPTNVFGYHPYCFCAPENLVVLVDFQL